jgi:hypothetical protein
MTSSFNAENFYSELIASLWLNAGKRLDGEEWQGMRSAEIAKVTRDVHTVLASRRELVSHQSEGRSYDEEARILSNVQSRISDGSRDAIQDVEPLLLWAIRQSITQIESTKPGSADDLPRYLRLANQLRYSPKALLKRATE